MTVERKQVKTPPQQLQVAKEDDEETAEESHNWRGIGISLLVIVGICSVIALAIILLTPRNPGVGLQGDPFYLSDVVGGDFVPRRFNGSWISDDHLEFRNNDGHLVIYSVRTKVTKKLVDNETFAENNVQKYSISANLKYVLFIYDIEQVYRHSFYAKYKIFDIASKRIFNFGTADDPEAKLQYVAWGPIGNQFVYVYENNIYYVPEVNDTHYPLTATGIDGVIFNGIPDWLYEEEILSSNHAIWWSPDGNLLCFATFNDSKLGTFYYNWYGNKNESQNVYPELFSLRYPKPGKENPSAFLWIADLRNPSKVLLRDVKPPREVQDQLVHVWFVVTSLVLNLPLL